MTFDETLKTIEWAKKLSDLTDDVMFKEAIKILSPVLGKVEDKNFKLDLQQQTALTYVQRSIDQYRSLFSFGETS
jgi:hypothetical protein